VSLVRFQFWPKNNPPMVGFFLARKEANRLASVWNRRKWRCTEGGAISRPDRGDDLSLHGRGFQLGATGWLTNGIEGNGDAPKVAPFPGPTEETTCRPLRGFQFNLSKCFFDTPCKQTDCWIMLPRISHTKGKGAKELQNHLVITSNLFYNLFFLGRVSN
jgi:hypothetical protein